MTEHHIGELLKVNFVNALAVAISISDFETSVRIFSCIAAGLYTIAKLVQTVQEIRGKGKKDEQSE